MSNKTIQPTEKQRAQLVTLKKNFGLSDSDIAKCLIFGPDQYPWIPTDLRVQIARSTKLFADIEPEFVAHVGSLNQIICKGRVTDLDGRSITRIGVATIGEKPGGNEIDALKLAEGRAIGAALDDQGFNPFKTGFVAVAIAIGGIGSKSGPSFGERLTDAKAAIVKSIQDDDEKIREIAYEAELRNKDLRQIHKLATDCGLTVGKDQRQYRVWLHEHYGVISAVLLDAQTRASVINALAFIEVAPDYLVDVPQELRADAAIA